MEYIFEEKFKVRDYECDLQGIVNNANYQHYMEHARHEYIQTLGVSFSKLHDEGIDLVVVRVDIRFKNSLRSGDDFVCKLNIKKEALKYVFYQDIYRISDNKLCARGVVESVATKDGQLCANEEIDRQLGL